MKLSDQTSGMGSDERLQKYKQAVKARDERIADLKAEIENVKQKMSKELAAVNQKMAFIMDEKDHQIKVIIFFSNFCMLTGSLNRLKWPTKPQFLAIERTWLR